MISRGEILLNGARQLGRLLPLRACLLDRVVQIRPGAGSRLSGLLRDSASSSRITRLANGRLFLQLDLIAMLVAIEEPVAGGTETLPDGF